MSRVLERVGYVAGTRDPKTIPNVLRIPAAVRLGDGGLYAAGALDVFYVAVQMKKNYRNGRVVNAAPEFDDCAAIARTLGLSVKDVQAIAVQAHGARPDAPERYP